MFIADAHCDTLYRMAIGGYAEKDLKVTPQSLAAGGVGLQTLAMFAGDEDGINTDFYQNGRKMLRALDGIGIPVLRGALEGVMQRGQPCAVVSIEGGEMLRGSLDTLNEFYRAARVRMIALTWNYENQIGYPAVGESGLPLKPFGRELIAEMDRLGILADVSHLNEAGFWDVCARTRLPVVASHSNLRSLCGVARNLTREQARAIIRTRGFIGVNFYAGFLRERGEATLEDVARVVDAICELGGEECVGFGSDFDGIERWPRDLESPADFPRLIKFLRERGYTQAQLENIAGRNFLRVLLEAERAGRARE